MIGKYKVKVKKRGMKLRESNAFCSLEVSPQGHNQQNEKLLSQILWVSEHFDKCFIHLTDLLDCYNFQQKGWNANCAQSQAKKYGDIWLDQNGQFFKYFNIPFEVIRWQHWLKHKDYAHIKTYIQQLYKNDIAFQKNVDSDVTSFLKRNLHKTNLNNGTEHFALSMAYVLEELVGHILMSKTHCPSRIYPGEQLLSAEYLQKIGLIQSPYLRITLNRRIREFSNAHHKQHDSLSQGQLIA